MSPCAYNESFANNFFPLEKEEVFANGWRWREEDERTYEITKKPDELPDNIKETTDDVLKEVIECADCRRGFKIGRLELDSLRAMNFPLPRECAFCRIGEKLGYWIDESRLTKSACDNCGTEFETPHKREDYPRILCRECWLQEVI